MFQRQSLTRFAGAPFAQGSHESVRFSALCRRENRSKNQGFKTESGSKTKVSHSPSVAFGASSLSEGACVCACFFSVPRKKATAKSKFSKLKVCTLFFCGSAVGHYVPSSGRKVSRESVTEGARGTEKRRKTAGRALSFSRSAPAPFAQGSL